MLVTGPRREGEEDGPEELHVVFLENGRRNLMGTKYEEMLACIRCGACLNVCPVYRKTAGEAYGPVYSGPDGGGARTAARRARQRAGASARVLALRRLHGGLPGQDPAARAAARAAPRPRRAARRVAARARGDDALVARLVERHRLPDARPSSAGSVSGSARALGPGKGVGARDASSRGSREGASGTGMTNRAALVELPATRT